MNTWSNVYANILLLDTAVLHLSHRELVDGLLIFFFFSIDKLYFYKAMLISRKKVQDQDGRQMNGKHRCVSCK